MAFYRKFIPFISLIGPGLLVMLADTDAGSIILAAQSGAQWGYSLLLLQLLLIPVLFMVQELAVRLGLVTGMGHGELIKNRFGNIAAWVSVCTLVICCVGALITEFSGLSAVGQLLNIPVPETLTLVVVFLIYMTWTGSYHSIERIAICLGIFELVFIWMAIRTHPPMTEIIKGSLNIPWTNHSYLYLVAGNIGAVIMPWMIFFQQSALCDKGLTVKQLNAARFDTLLGAFVTQMIMISVLILAANTLGKTNPNAPLNSVTDISKTLIPLIGVTYGRLFFILGMSGAAFVATIVVSLTAAWGIGEVFGFKRSLEDHPTEAPWFYASYIVIIIFSAFMVAFNLKNLVKITIAIEVMNALFLPIVLGFLYSLAVNVLPDKYRLKGIYKVIVASIITILCILGIFGAFSWLVI